MRYLKITLAYDGTDYAGWQWQANGKSLQQAFEEAWLKITGEKSSALASGRTDAGVHALAQLVGIRTESELTCDSVRRALNATLPNDMVVLDVADAPPGFHPIRDAERKRYRYLIHDGHPRDVFTLRYAWQIPQPLDHEAMQRAAAPLVGEHDFVSFEAAGSERESTVRHLYELSVRREPAAFGQQIVIEVESDGFLYNMVRILVGTLAEVGRGAQAETWPAEVLAACNRRTAGPTAPAHGLCLVSVTYGESARPKAHVRRKRVERRD